MKRLASRSRVCAIWTSGSFAAVGIPCSGGPHPVTFRAIFFFALFEAVQTKLTEQTNNHKATRTNSEALLTGRIFDDRGNRMTPSHARKGGMRYRHYLSSALLHGAANRAGSVSRVRAVEIAALAIRTLREHLEPLPTIEDRALINDFVARVEIQPERLVIHLAEAPGKESHQGTGNILSCAVAKAKLNAPPPGAFARRGRVTKAPSNTLRESRDTDRVDRPRTSLAR